MFNKAKKEGRSIKKVWIILSKLYFFWMGNEKKSLSARYNSYNIMYSKKET